MTEINWENLKKEIDTSGNEKIEIQEMEEFLKTDENIKRLWEVMSSGTSPELQQEMENALKILCDEITKKQNINDISPNQYKILSFYMACWKENQNEQTYKKVWIFIGKLYKNYQKELKKYSEGKWEKPSNVIAQFFEEELQQQINKISQLAEKRLKEMEDEMNPLIQQQRKEEERQNKLLERWENDKRDIENLLQKDWELSEEDKQRLSYFRDFYYNEGHILYKNTWVNTEISNLLTYELWWKWLSFGIVGYDKIANQIDNKLNSWLFNFIDKIINNWELSKDIKWLKQINEWIMKFWRNNPEKYEQLNWMISNEIINISKKTFENEDSDRLTESQVWTFQLWTNINYWENLIIDWIRWNKPFGNGENQEITNLYIYREEICSRNSKKYDILKIPNLDNILKSLQSKDKEHKIFKEFMIFFLKIKQPWKYFEVQIWNENLENILKFIVSTEKYKNVSIDDYLNLYFNGDLTDNEKSQKIALKEQLSQYETIDWYFKDKAKKLIKLCLEKSNKIVEIDNELHLQNKIKEFYELFWDLKWDKNKKEKLEKLWKEILNNPRLQKEQRKEILIMLWWTFSEIETKRNEISVRKWFQRICRWWHFSDLAPNTIKYTQWCNIKVEYLKNIIDTDRYFPKWQEPLNLTIYLDWTPLAIGGPLQIGKKFKHNWYDIHIDKNKNLIIKKLWWSWSELRDTFWDKIYNEYQIAQNELNEKSKRHEEISDIQAQVESDNWIKIHSISQEEKKIINDETWYTEKYKKYKSACEWLRYAQTQYAKYPDAPNYTEYHHLNIPWCDWQLVHITPSELIKIKTAINKHWNSICYNPKNKSNNKIHELKLSDLNISEKDKNGNIHLYEINNNGNQWKEIKKFSATDLSEIWHTNNLVMKSIQIAPWLKDALEKASRLSKDLEYIEDTYKKFDQAKLTNEDAKNIMIKADSIIKFLNELCNHHNDFVQLKKWLEQRHSWKSNIDTESEKTIKLIISNLDYLINATVSWWEIKKYCESFLNEKKIHSNDDRTERTIWRFRNNWIKTIFAILWWVAAVCLVPVSWWWSLALLQMSMIMTAWWMVWWFTWQIANEQINNTFTKPIVLENWETIQVRYDDPTSLELAIKWEISRKDFAIDTWINFALWTATTFWCMAAGQFIWRRITKACESWNISPKFELFLRKFNKNFKVENWDPMTDSMFKEIANKISQNPKSLISKFNESFFREFKDELWEEITESWFEEIWKWLRNNNPWLAVICSWLASLATAWHCLTPGWNMTKMYKENWISIWDLNFSGWNSTIEITLDYNGNRDAIIKYYTENWYKEVNWHLTMKNADNPEITNIIHLRETKVPIEVRSFASELSWYWINIDSKTWKWYYQNISKIQDLELSWKANVTIDPETKKVTIISWETTLELEQDYFGWKSHKFDINTTQARWNSEMMDNLLNQINEQNQSKKLEELRKQISEQYKQSTWEDLNLTDEQLLSILDAHEQDWKLWELTLWQLRQKVKILDETITDSKVRRFLLEAGFCGRPQEVHQNINIWNQNCEITYRWDYWEMKITNPDGTITNIDFQKNGGESKYLEIFIENWWKIENYTTIEQLCKISEEMWAWWKIWFAKELIWNLDNVIDKQILEKLINSENFSENAIEYDKYNKRHTFTVFEKILSFNVKLPQKLFNKNFLTQLINSNTFFEARAKVNYQWNELNKIYFHEMIWKYIDWIDLNSCNSELLSDLIIDYHFDKISYNVFLDIKELLRFQIEKWNFLSNEKLKIYKDILNIDKLSNEEKIELHKSLIWKNVSEMFENDIQKARETSKIEIADSILNHETIKQYKDEELSKKYWINVYNFNWQPFYALAKVWRVDRINPEYAVTRSFSLVWTECIWVWGEPWNDTFLYEWLTHQQIIHISNDDSWSWSWMHDEYWQKTDYVFRLWSPSELLSNTRGYNELIILEKWTQDTVENHQLNEIKPIAIYCYEITEDIIKTAKEYGVWIALINTQKYGGKNTPNKWHDGIFQEYMYPWNFNKSEDYYYAKENRRSEYLITWKKLIIW